MDRFPGEGDRCLERSQLGLCRRREDGREEREIYRAGSRERRL